jgi:ribosomal protein L37E
MSYLVCNQCGGYYELQPGESPDDFGDICECGGNLKYVHKLDNQKICPNCGKVTDKNSEICSACGFKFTKSLVTNKKHNSKSEGYSHIIKFVLIGIFVISPAICIQAYVYLKNPFPTNYVEYFFYFYPMIAMTVAIIIYFIQKKNTVF